MVQTLEAIKGGGGSIKVGTTGKISSLMTRELEQITSSSRTPVSSKSKTQTASVSVPCGSARQKRLMPRKSLGEASSTRNSDSTNWISPENVRKAKGYGRHTHRIPILGSDNIVLDGTPTWRKTDKKASNIVEVVDIKCGNPDKTWASPIANRLKKLGFSKLSETIG